MAKESLSRPFNSLFILDDVVQGQDLEPTVHMDGTLDNAIATDNTLEAYTEGSDARASKNTNFYSKRHSNVRSILT